MKKLVFLSIMLIIGFHGFSQCHINPYIQDTYELDAKILALREILSDPSDPDYDNPFLPEERYIPYLERLSALYENPFNSPVVDSIFNKFRFHVNQEYQHPIEFKKISFSVNWDVTWLEDFKNTGISGVAALDNLISQYQFSIFETLDLSSCSCTFFYLETGFDFLNLYALIDDFELIADIENVEVNVYDLNTRFNYTGIPYNINNKPVEACDIEVGGDTFVFILYAGDCMSGCTETEYRFARVTEDCEVLAKPTNEFENFSLYPNPTSDKIYLKGIPTEVGWLWIYSVQGKLLQSSKNIPTEIDVSQLSPGLYFMKLVSSEGSTITSKFIKQ